MEFNTISSSFGKNLLVRIWGGTHEPYVGADILGFPEGQTLDFAKLERFMARRSPSANKLGSSPRTESDSVIITSGLRDFTTSCEKLSLKIRNQDIDKSAYDLTFDIPRPGHADYPAKVKYGDSLDLSGGGPFSARMTAPLCAAGGITMQYLETQNIFIAGRIYSIAGIQDEDIDYTNPDLSAFLKLNREAIPCFSRSQAEKMQHAIEHAVAENDSVGSVVEAFVWGLPVGLGSPMYQGIESVLAPILFAIPAVKAVSFGSGTAASSMLGSQHNDSFRFENGKIVTPTNNHGGIFGGLATGMPLYCKVYFKPTASIMRTQNSVNLKTGENCELNLRGRHDSCLGIRAVPIVEAALALGICDILLSEQNNPLQSSCCKDLDTMRKSIDFIDSKLAEFLLYRYDLVSQIGKLKKENSLPIEGAEREEFIKNSLKKIVNSAWDIDADIKPKALSYISDIFELIITKSKEVQKNDD